MLSMTGYGTARVQAGSAAVVIEARAVNHRYLDVRVRLSGELADCAVLAEQIARKTLERGRVEISGRREASRTGGVTLDRARARAALEQLRALRDELAPNEPVPLSLLAAVPELFSSGDSASFEDLSEAVAQATTQACAALCAMRAAEGRALELDLSARVARMGALLSEVSAHTTALNDRLRARLRTRIATLLEGTGVALDASRFEQEVALLADRADVCEEITRLHSHFEQIGTLLAPSAEAIGRRLEFVLQEVGREINTLGSKVGEVAVTRLVVELKTELERMREQAQNVL